MTETVLSNARIILPDREIHGTVVVRDGKIAEIDDRSSAVGDDLGGDCLIPGLVELHTDHLESHYVPRPGVRWDQISAIQAYDAQIASSGITTVFDCFRLGTVLGNDLKVGEAIELAQAVTRAQSEQRLRAEHFAHLRCEVSSSNLLSEFASFTAGEPVRLASMMDHSPGQRQFQIMDQYILFYKTKGGMSDEEFNNFVDHRINESEQNSSTNRDTIANLCREMNITLASHDDATLEHVEDAVAKGVRLAEFPTTVEAAKSSHENGMSVLMGAPNVVRGSSHSGNLSARDLAAAATLDVLSSDYVPISLIQAPFVLASEIDGMDLPAAIALVTDNPAKTVGLDDRGRIEVGRRADLVRVRDLGDMPVVSTVWRGGERVA